MADYFSDYIVDTMLTTETYADPRAKAAAEEHLEEQCDMPYPSRSNSCQGSRAMSVYTEYGTYTRETVHQVYSPRASAEIPATTQQSPSSWKRKFSINSPFKKNHNQKKRPAELMEPTPSPRHSPGSSSKSFFPAVQFHRPSMIRRNAWIGRSKEEVGETEPVDACITGTEQFAVDEPDAVVAEPEPQSEVGDTAQRRPIDVSDTQEERPKKRPRLASLPSFVGRLSKSFYSAFKELWFEGNENIFPVTAWLDSSQRVNIAQWRFR
jgi:hypothetical protein